MTQTDVRIHGKRRDGPDADGEQPLGPLGPGWRPATGGPSHKAETYTWGVEIECFLPQGKVQELGISIGSYHHGHPLPYPFPQACPERSERGWTAERDGSLRTNRRGYVAVEIVSPILKGRTGIEQVNQLSRVLTELGAAVNLSCGLHCHP